ncbi:MAG: hypothetical protein H6807_13840 [Planctomycetes bacterium]|nr:hypothetical protein [Planctomycetota bacterium]
MSRPSVLVLVVLGLVASLASGQVANPSFDGNNIGVPVNWIAHGVGGNVGSQVLPDVGMPTDGSRYAVIFAGSSGPATPHDNEGGTGTGAGGTMSLSQGFSFVDLGMTTINFDCVLVGNDDVPDFFEAEISDGTTTLNLVHLDVLNDLGGPTSLLTGLPSSGIVSVSVDLGPYFPTATFATVFSLSFHVGNAVDTAVPARAYVDDVHFTPGTPFNENSIRYVPGGAWVTLEIRTEAPFMEYYNVISHVTTFPKGSGPFGGIWPDAQTWAFVTMPLGSTGIHDFSDANGLFSVPVWAGIAATGFQFDYFLAAVTPGGGYRLTPVKRGAWNVAEDI